MNKQRTSKPNDISVVDYLADRKIDLVKLYFILHMQIKEACHNVKSPYSTASDQNDKSYISYEKDKGKRNDKRFIDIEISRRENFITIYLPFEPVEIDLNS